MSLNITHRSQTHGRRGAQLGGTAMGIIVGLLVGLGVALAVALYVTKVPVPFVNKVPQRSHDQDAAEAEKNRNWDPNAKLGSQPGPKATAGTPPVGPVAPGPSQSNNPVAATGPVVPPYVPPVPPLTTSTPGSARTGSAVPNGQTPAATPARTAPPAVVAPATQTAPPPAVATAPPAKPGADPFIYFVQAGAYSRQEDADQQRARLAILGHNAKVTEREQVGRTMFRVRLGPFESKDVANTTQAKLQQSGIEAALVAVERNR